MAVFMETLIDPPVNGAFWVNLVANCFGLTLTSFLAGWLSDRLGRVKVMMFGAISVAIAGPFMVLIISRGNTVEALFAQTALCFFLSFYCGVSECLQFIVSPRTLYCVPFLLGTNEFKFEI